MANIRNIINLAVSTTLLLATGSPVIADSYTYMDPKADALLKKMSDYIGGLKSFTVDAFLFEEQIMADGFKMSVLQSGTVKVQRPEQFFISRKGDAQNQEFLYNGSHLVINNRHSGVYINVPVTGRVDDVLDAASDTFGVEIPGRDIVSTDAYTALIEPVEESSYLGAVEIDGVTCRQLVFRTDEVDWQLWVQEGNRPLPCRYTITSKWTYAAPQYTVTFTNWEVNPKLPPATFDFTAPDGARSVNLEEYQKVLSPVGGE
jgi:hypothetical protein